MMMDLEPGWDDDDDEIMDGANDDGKTTKTKKTGKSGSSRKSKAVSKAQTNKKHK